ncbi:hypothetical protein [Brachybacterium sp. FME24]|uniref:hypothetical protein n=1 Tax=Brachybacterium sp. FME24 TaxID=2742605 RepID=UPI001865E074|nr:hypothetical protein [Brachybacterium sp. FME24]
MTLTLLTLTMAYWPPLVALLLATVVALLRHRRATPLTLPASVRRWLVTGVGSALALLLLLPVLSLPGVIPHLPRSFLADWHGLTLTGLAAPLVAGIVATALLALPMPERDGSGTADLSRRTAFGFVARPWALALAASAAAALGLAIAAGMASTLDDQGRRTMYVVDVGTTAVGSTIYGWFFSVPCLVLLAVLLATSAATTVLISRPPWDRDRKVDTSIRRRRTRDVLTVAVGALLLHLSGVLRFLANTAALEGGMTAGDGTWFWAITPFSALETALRFLGNATDVAGWLLWLLVLLATLAGSARHRTTAERAAWTDASH